MLDMGQQPEMVPVGNRMTGQRHQLTAAQRRQVRATFGNLRGSLSLSGCISAALKLELTHCRLLALDLEERSFAEAKMPLTLTKHHAMPALAVFEMVVKPFLGAQTLDKLQV